MAEPEHKNIALEAYLSVGTGRYVSGAGERPIMERTARVARRLEISPADERGEEGAAVRRETDALRFLDGERQEAAIEVPNFAGIFIGIEVAEAGHHPVEELAPLLVEAQMGGAEEARG